MSGRPNRHERETRQRRRSDNRDSDNGTPSKVSKSSLEDFDYFALGKRKADLKERFNALDKNGNGHLSMYELEQSPEFEKILADSDLNKDNVITFDEFWTTMKKTYWPEMKTAEEMMANAVGNRRWELRQRFYQLDKDNDGILTMGEIYRVDDRLLDIFYKIDKDQNSEMTFDELWEHVSGNLFTDIPEEVNLRAFFYECDTDGSGYLSYQEIAESIYYKEKETLAKSLDAMMDMDSDGDGKVSIEEFLENWRQMHRKKKDTRRSLEMFDFFRLAEVKADMKALFKDIDRNRSGRISTYEIRKSKDLKRYLNQGLYNLAKDGSLKFDEFWSYIRKECYPDMLTAEEMMADYVATERSTLRKKFKSLDQNKDGKLTLKEIKGKDKALEEIFQEIKKDENTKLTFDELWELVSAKLLVSIPEEVNLRAFFAECDEDHSGFLSYDEIKKSRYYKENEKNAKYLDSMKDMDKNDDGKVSIEEFLDNWRRMERRKRRQERK